MNKNTKKVFDILTKYVDGLLDSGSDELNDALSGAEVDGEKINQDELETMIAQYLAEKAQTFAEELVGSVQQVYDL